MKEITDLSEEDADWLAGHVATLERLDIDLDPVVLDAYLERARVSEGTLVVNLVGAGLGQILVDRLDLRWVSVTDKRGTRIGLYGDAKKTLVFPFEAVARRRAGESGSLAKYVAETVATIQKLRAAKAG
ncbi:DUF3806 domain-containing protein [Microbacterium sp. HJ5]